MMIKHMRMLALVATLFVGLIAGRSHAANIWQGPQGDNFGGEVSLCLNSLGQAVPVFNATGAYQCAAPQTFYFSSQYPAGATPITASATGTTAATTATLAANASLKTYICGFAIRANATSAATGNSTVTGTITGTLNFTQWTAPLASGIGLNEQRFSPCIPSSAINTAIAVISAAPGTGGTISVTAWGYQL